MVVKYEARLILVKNITLASCCSLDCRRVSRHTMAGSNRPKRGKARSGKGLATRIYLGAVLAVAVALPSSASPAALVDWSEWDGQPAVHISERRPENTDATSGATTTLTTARCLRRLVRECSLQLELQGPECEDDTITSGGFRVPVFYSRPSCGFEVRFVEDNYCM